MLGKPEEGTPESGIFQKGASLHRLRDVLHHDADDVPTLPGRKRYFADALCEAE